MNHVCTLLKRANYRNQEEFHHLHPSIFVFVVNQSTRCAIILPFFYPADYLQFFQIGVWLQSRAQPEWEASFINRASVWGKAAEYEILSLAFLLRVVLHF